MADRPGSVERALRILEFVAHQDRAQSHSDISRHLDIPKSTATKLLQTLERLGYLRRSRDDGRYEIGLKVVGLGQSALSGLDLRRISQPVLRRLVEQTRLTVHLAILDHGRPVYIDRAENPGFIKMNTWIGRELSLHTTSVGKVLAADLPPEELATILKRDGLAKKTDKTITTKRAFLQELETVRQNGYAVDDEENNLGVRCVAVPVHDRGGRVGAAIGLSGATSQVRQGSEEVLARLASKSAQTISSQMGHDLVWGNSAP